jgi:hypothetical protein
MKQVKRLLFTAVLVISLGAGAQAGDMGSPGAKCVEPGDMGSPGATPCPPPKPLSKDPVKEGDKYNNINDPLFQEFVLTLIRLIY